MSRLVQRCFTVLFVLFVVSGIGFGASQAFGAGGASTPCGWYANELGCCNPYLYDTHTCMEVCWHFGYEFGGACLRVDDPNDDDWWPCRFCCTCLE